MRRYVRVLVAVTSLLTVSLSALQPVSAAEHSLASDQAFVEKMLYSTPMSVFIATAKTSNGGDTWNDWTTDFCSAPLVGNTGRSFNFTDSCRRHDFGYRNAQLLERRYGVDYWNATSRRRIDTQMLADMKASCAPRSLLERPTCYGWAYTFYNAVRIAGGP